MQPADVVSIMRQEARQIIAQVERAQAGAASLAQWYASIGGTTWINDVPAETWTAAGITKSQMKKALEDCAWFASLLEGKWTNGPNGAGGGVWTANNLGENLYKVELR